MQIGIIGLPMTGKTTLFQLLTGAAEGGGKIGGRADAQVGVAHVPDERLDFLAQLFHPRKVTPATLQVTDTAGFVPGEGEHARLNEFLNVVRQSDALIHVLRVWETEVLPHPRGRIDPLRDAQDVETELLLADLDVVEKGRQRLLTGKKLSQPEQDALPVLERCQEALEEERPLRDVGLSPEEEYLLRNYGFLTLRPLLLAVNLSDEQWNEADYPGRTALLTYAEQRKIEVVPFAGQLEKDISVMPAQERAEFMGAYGVTTLGNERLAQAAYRALGLISFLTAGEDEVRAWPIPAGSSARKAAGRIHSDLERGFIRAEVVPFATLQRLGSMKAVREQGLLRVEGKDYIVQDGDVLNIRFNV